jgi:hypothetical protein
MLRYQSGEAARSEYQNRKKLVWGRSRLPIRGFRVQGWSKSSAGRRAGRLGHGDGSRPDSTVSSTSRAGALGEGGRGTRR